MKYDTAVIIMASGQSKRMGEQNKLLLPFGSHPLFEHVLRTTVIAEIPMFVVSCYPEILHTAKKLGGNICQNTSPQKGQSYSMQLGIQAAKNYDGLFFLPADQPFLSAHTLLAMKSLFLKSHSIVTAAFQQKRCSPTLFPKTLYDQLLRVTGDKGGKEVLNKHKKNIIYYQMQNTLEAVDIDTLELYKTYVKRLNQTL